MFTCALHYEALAKAKSSRKAELAQWEKNIPFAPAWPTNASGKLFRHSRRRFEAAKTG